MALNIKNERNSSAEWRPIAEERYTCYWCVFLHDNLFKGLITFIYYY